MTSSKTWFYHYTGGYCGTDVYGLIEAETENQAVDDLQPEAYEAMENNIPSEEFDDDGNITFEIETDVVCVPYEPYKHNMHLSPYETGYIPDIWIETTVDTGIRGLREGVRLTAIEENGGMRTEYGWLGQGQYIRLDD